MNEIDFAPSVQMVAVPPAPTGMDSEAEKELDDADEDQNKDVRFTLRQREKMVADEDGYVSDSDDEDEQHRRPTRRNQMGYRDSLSSLTKGKAAIEDYGEDIEQGGDEDAEVDVEDDSEGDIEEDAEEDVEKGIEDNGIDDDIENEDEDTTGLEIEAHVSPTAENGAEILDSESEGEVASEVAAGQTTPPSPGADESVQFTPARSDTSELEGDTVMVDVPSEVDDITT